MKSLDYSIIRKPLFDLLDEIDLRLSREPGWRKVGGEENLLCVRYQFLIAYRTYRSIVYLLTPNNIDRDRNPGWREDLALAVPPLTRTIIDGLCNVVLFFDGTPEIRIQNFRRAGWNGANQELKAIRKLYPRGFRGSRRNRELLDGWRKELEKELGLSKKEIETERWWPNLGQAKSGKNARKECRLNPPLSQDRIDFLTFLHDRYYGKFSNASHLSWRGMRDRAWYFHAPPSKRKVEMAKFISEQLTYALTFLIAFLSEIQSGMGYADLQPRVRSLWSVLCPIWTHPKAVYTSRYQKFYGPLPPGPRTPASRQSPRRSVLVKSRRP